LKLSFVQCLTLFCVSCEVKYRDEKIGMSVITEVEAKIATYPNPKKMSVEPVLITASEPTRELAESEFFTRILTLEDLFGR
jgi:hypothetical protein